MVGRLIINRFLLKNSTYRVVNTAPWKDPNFKPFGTYTNEEWRVWVRKKWDLLYRYNLPTVKSQTSQDFTYLLLINKDFPGLEEIKPELDSFNEGDNIKIVYVDFAWGDGAPTQGQFALDISDFTTKYVHRNLPDCDWVVTTRLDSDDGISYDFMERLADETERKEGWVLFKTGYIYEASKDRCMWHSDYLSPYHSFIEPNREKIQSVYHRMHNKLGFAETDTDKAVVVSSNHRGWFLEMQGHTSNICKSPHFCTIRLREKEVPKEEVMKYIKIPGFVGG